MSSLKLLWMFDFKNEADIRQVKQKRLQRWCYHWYCAASSKQIHQAVSSHASQDGVLFSDGPLQLKRGLACIFKNKGKAVSIVHAWRSIMLCNLLIKHHHAFMRTRLCDIIHSNVYLTQTGGIKKRGTDLPNSLIRWCQHGLISLGKLVSYLSLSFVPLFT